MYDYGARGYMPDLGRWGGVDPLAERYYAYSGYNYVANNPFLYFDIDGMKFVNPYEEEFKVHRDKVNELKSKLADAKESGNKQESKNIKREMKELGSKIISGVENYEKVEVLPKNWTVK